MFKKMRFGKIKRLKQAQRNKENMQKQKKKQL